nr:AAA family ATPase [Lysobacter sp. Root559]
MEEGLNCIAITDHNFASKDFIDLLRAANLMLSNKGVGSAVHILPGFELEADVGKGIHALAIFDVDVALDEIDHVLTTCGVAFPRFDDQGRAKSSTKNLKQIIQDIQKRKSDGRLSGLVICAHPMGAHGIFDNDAVADWLQREEWTNPELLAVEIPKPVAQMSRNWQKLFANEDDCLPEWKRIRPIGRFMSSDCKAFTSVEDADNYIGKRFCWVKMSEPSVESLRQASLDHESRMWFGANQPEVLHTHITKLKIEGAKFLANQELNLSPHLNCIIGGRGSGKSTILEYLRIALRAFPSGYKESDKSAAARQIKRIRSTLSPESKITVELSHRGVEEQINVVGDNGVGVLGGREIADVGTVFQQFGVLAFSQDEVTELASERSFLSLIDEAVHSELSELRRLESDLKTELRGLYNQRRSRVTLEGELAKAEQSLSEVRRQLEATAELQGELRTLQLAEAAVATVQGYADVADAVQNKLGELAEWLGSQADSLPAVAENVGSADLLESIRARVLKGMKAAKDVIKSEGVVFSAASDISAGSADLGALSQKSVEARAGLERACAERGISSAALDQLNELADEQARSMRLVTDLKARQNELLQREAKIPEVQTKLFDAWSARADIRRREFTQILESSTMPRTSSGKPILDPSIIPCGDKRSFSEHWEKYAPDRRSVLGRAWSSENGIGSIIYDAFCASGEQGNPVWWLDSRLDNPNAPLPEPVESNRKLLTDYRIREWEHWEEMLLHWNDDAGDIKLLRTDDTIAGSLANRDLSDGQQNTAILSLLLARGEGPVLIDQPESELDSSFLYTELVPMLRQAKKGRQLIVVTHNANIPVNGDAELIYALESVGGHGVPKSEGGLDREAVTQAVVDIMEGTEEAFRRRREKYHF